MTVLFSRHRKKFETRCILLKFKNTIGDVGFVCSNKVKRKEMGLRKLYN